MAKLMNVSGVPVSFDGANGTVRFFRDDVKVIEDKDMTLSLKDGVESGVLAVMPEEKPVVEEPKVEDGSKSKKKGKEEA